MSDHSEQLPSYTAQEVKRALLRAGASGTVYSLVMPESEAALASVMDGGDRQQIIGQSAQAWLADNGTAPPDPAECARAVSAELNARRTGNYFDMYREAWTQKQDALHDDYFAGWFDWILPVVSVNRQDFPYRYPTAGASEGIFKIMAEHAAAVRSHEGQPVIHMFEGEYEGFPAYAGALGIEVIRHRRQDWKAVTGSIGKHAQFWISQPSAIDGKLWDPFEELVEGLNQHQPEAQLVPDLTYVGNVARPYRIELTSPNIPAIVFSHSKPFGGYYHRIGGVAARREYPSLFGNKWFKNLQSLAWAGEMMRRHDVFALAKKYRPIQERAAQLVGKVLGIDNLEPTDVSVLATAKPDNVSDLLSNVLRGSGDETVIRLCLTPAMAYLIDPGMAPQTSPELRRVWDTLDAST